MERHEYIITSIWHEPLNGSLWDMICSGEANIFPPATDNVQGQTPLHIFEAKPRCLLPFKYIHMILSVQKFSAKPFKIFRVLFNVTI